MSLNDLYILVTGSAIAISCGLLGSFLILRKMAMIGDAISHAVLPGIVLAFLISGSRDNIPMLIGAAGFGLLTTVLIELFHKKARLQEDASIGVTFTWLFALGVILISVFSGQVDLDQDCVLYGEIAYVPLDLLIGPDGSIWGPRPMWIGIGLLLMVVIFIIIGYRGLLVSTFNPAYAVSIGISASVWHYLLMGMVSFTTVVSFESVGAILVVALMIAPPATAYLWTGRLRRMLLLTAIFGVLSTIFGYYLAVWINGSVAGGMATASGVFFGIAYVRYRILSNRAIYSNGKHNEHAISHPEMDKA